MGHREELLRIYDLLHAHYGDLDWWPGKTPLEVCVGAILTQNTAWTNVEKAIADLKRARALSVRRLRDMPEAELAGLIRSAGYFNVKARRLKAFIAFLCERHGGSLARLFDRDVPSLRAVLLSVDGIGRETADSIVLYAAEKPTFVVDAYTHRVFHRHGLLPEEADYDEVKDLFESSLPMDTALWNDYHAQVVNVGKDYCRKRPRCSGCPLEGHPHTL